MLRNLRSRKITALAATCVAGVLAISGCSSDEPNKPAPSKTPSSSAAATTPEIDPNAPEGILPPELRPDTTGEGAVLREPIPNPTPVAESGTINCDGLNLDLTASNVTITLEGNCRGILVSGSNVTLNGPSIVQARITGDNVTYNGDLVGWLIIEGSDAKVDLRMGYRFGIQTDGSNNTVTYLMSETENITDNGTGNSITKK